MRQTVMITAHRSATFHLKNAYRRQKALIVQRSSSEDAKNWQDNFVPTA